MSMLFFVLFSSFLSTGGFSSSEVYDLLDEGSLKDIDLMLDKLEAYGKDSRVQAFAGALWTKKAGLSSSMKDKVQYFKKGALMIDGEINHNPNEVEYRFLRLAVQENSPAILGYKDNLEEDKRMILNNFLSLDTSLQNQIRSYAKNSQIILLAELSNKPK